MNFARLPFPTKTTTYATMSALSSEPPPKPPVPETANWDNWKNTINEVVKNMDDNLFAQTLLDEVFASIRESRLVQSFRLEVRTAKDESDYTMTFVVGEGVDISAFARIFKKYRIYDGKMTFTSRGVAGVDFRVEFVVKSKALGEVPPSEYNLVAENALSTDLKTLMLPSDDVENLRKIMLMVANMSKYVPEMSWDVSRQVTMDSLSTTCKPFCEASMNFFCAMLDAVPSIEHINLTEAKAAGPVVRRNQIAATFVCARRPESGRADTNRPAKRQHLADD